MSIMMTPEGQIAYQATGPADAPLLLLVHGMGDTATTFRLLTPPLVAAGYRVVTIDVRGYGLPAPTGPTTRRPPWGRTCSVSSTT